MCKAEEVDGCGYGWSGGGVGGMGSTDTTFLRITDVDEELEKALWLCLEQQQMRNIMSRSYARSRL